MCWDVIDVWYVIVLLASGPRTSSLSDVRDASCVVVQRCGDVAILILRYGTQICSLCRWYHDCFHSWALCNHVSPLSLQTNHWHFIRSWFHDHFSFSIFDDQLNMYNCSAAATWGKRIVPDTGTFSAAAKEMIKRTVPDKAKHHTKQEQTNNT